MVRSRNSSKHLITKMCLAHAIGTCIYDTQDRRTGRRQASFPSAHGIYTFEKEGWEAEGTSPGQRPCVLLNVAMLISDPTFDRSLYSYTQARSFVPNQTSRRALSRNIHRPFQLVLRCSATSKRVFLSPRRSSLLTTKSVFMTNTYAKEVRHGRHEPE